MTQDQNERFDLTNRYIALGKSLEKLELARSHDRTVLTMLQEDGARGSRNGREAAPIERSVSDMRLVVSAMQEKMNDVIKKCTDFATLHTEDISLLREKLQELQEVQQLTSDRSQDAWQKVLELRQEVKSLQEIGDANDSRFQEFGRDLDRQSQWYHNLQTSYDDSRKVISHDLELLARHGVRDAHDLKTSRWQEDKVHVTLGLDGTSARVENSGTEQRQRVTLVKGSEERITPIDLGTGSLTSPSLASLRDEHKVVRKSWSSASNETHVVIAREVSSTYALKPNVWDASLMVCFSCLGWGANVMLFIALALNTLIQASFCVIVATLPESTDDYTQEIVLAVQKWREAATTERREAVCDFDDSLSSDYFQLSKHDEAQSYLSPLMFGTFLQGPVLCLVVITVWSLNVAQVIREALDFSMAVGQQHKYDAKTMRLESHIQRFSLHDFPTHRVLWAWFLVAVQLCVALTLLLCGSWWLVATTQISDLVLNAVALGYITQIDEVMFSTVIPRQVRALVNNMEPLPLIRYCGNVPVTGIFLWIGVIVFCVVIGVLWLMPHVARVWDIETALCG